MVGPCSEDKMSEDLTRAIFSLAFVLLNWFLWEALGRCHYDFEKGKSVAEALFGASSSIHQVLERRKILELLEILFG
jgi:hypothetical protein